MSEEKPEHRNQPPREVSATQPELLSVRRENIFQDGPYLNAALLCEHIIDERDGVKSVFRIVDRITQSVAGEDVPDRMPPFDYRLAMLIRLKPGETTGKYEVKVELVKPDKTRAPAFVATVNLEAGGKDIKINLGMNVEQEGTYWFEIYLSGILLTKIPLQVLYLIQTHGRTDVQTLM
jgi:hypothetical protein